MGCFTPTSNSPTLTPTEYPTVKSRHYLPGVIIRSHKFKDSVPKAVLTLDTNPKSQATHTSDQSSIKLGISPTSSSDLILGWNVSENFGRHLHLSAYSKGFNWTARWRGSQKGPENRSSYPSVEVGVHTTPWPIAVFTNPEANRMFNTPGEINCHLKFF